MARSVVLLSGGLNSCVAAWVARQESELALLHIRYGHRAAQREEHAFERIAAELGVEHCLIVDLPHMLQMRPGARVNRREAIEDASSLEPKVANTFIPGLLPTMIGIAQTWASVLGAHTIVIGAAENLGPPGPPSETIHPDCRRRCYQLLDHLLELTSAGKSAIRLHTPVIDLSRSEIIRLGRRLGAPLHLTWSCYRGEEHPCGICYGCATRARGFAAAGMPDPLLRSSMPGRGQPAAASTSTSDGTAGGR